MDKSSIVGNLLSNGWAVVTTAVSSDELAQTYRLWREFFSSAEKWRFEAPAGALEGFFGFGSECAGKAKKADPKEFFHFYSWGKCPEACLESTSLLFSSLSSAAKVAMEALSQELPFHDWPDLVVNSSQLLLRVSHYGKSEKNVHLAASHTDINLFTLLPPATVSGLQVLSKRGRWQTIPDIANNQAVVLIGDMLALASNQRFCATTHRVSSSETERMSLSFFVNPPMDAVLSGAITAGQMLESRRGRLSTIE